MSWITKNLLSRTARPLLAALLSILFLSWPAILNGGAFFFPDTSSYLRGADAALHEAMGFQSEWGDKRYLYVRPNYAATPNGGSGVEHSGLGTSMHPVLLGRSVYYGLSILPLVVAFSSVGGALLQAAFAVLNVRLVLVATGVSRVRVDLWQVITVLSLACLTPLPFFVSLLMPDVFAGFAVCLTAAGAVGWSRLLVLERVALVLTLLLSAMVHTSHFLILFGLLGLSLVLRLCGAKLSKAGIAVIFLACSGALVGEWAFKSAIVHRLGETPIRPPFLTARLIDEGPGFDLLTRRCPNIGFEACHFLNRMPFDSDAFLWSTDRTKGVFSVESHDVQRRLANQDLSFAAATLRFAPAAVFEKGARAALRQASLLHLNIFNAESPPEAGGGLADNLPPSYAREVRRSLYGKQRMPVAFFDLATQLSGLVSAAMLAAAFLLNRRVSILKREAALFAAFLLFGFCINIVLTGTLSKPHDRYNIRLIWILPLGALALVARWQAPALVKDEPCSPKILEA